MAAKEMAAAYGEAIIINNGSIKNKIKAYENAKQYQQKRVIMTRRNKRNGGEKKNNIIISVMAAARHRH